MRLAAKLQFGGVLMSMVLASAIPCSYAANSGLGPLENGNNGLLGLGVLSGENTGSGGLLGLGLLTNDSLLGLELTRASLLDLGDVADPLADAVQTLGAALRSNNVTLPGLNDPRDLTGMAPGALDLAPLAGLAVGNGADATGSLAGVGLFTSDGALNTNIISAIVAGGDNSATGDLAGAAVLSGNNAGNGGAVGAGILSGDRGGNGGLLGLAALSGNDAGNGGLIGASILSGANSGNGGLVGVSILSTDNGGNGGLAGASLLSGSNTGTGGLIGAAIGSDANSGNTLGLSFNNLRVLLGAQLTNVLSLGSATQSPAAGTIPAFGSDQDLAPLSGLSLPGSGSNAGLDVLLIPANGFARPLLDLTAASGGDITSGTLVDLSLLESGNLLDSGLDGMRLLRIPDALGLETTVNQLRLVLRGIGLQLVPTLNGLPVGNTLVSLLGTDISNAGEDLVGVLLGPILDPAGNVLGLALLRNRPDSATQQLGVGILAGDNDGNGDIAGVGALSGDNTGNGDLLGVAALSGQNSESARLASVGLLNDGQSVNPNGTGTNNANGSDSGSATAGNSATAPTPSEGSAATDPSTSNPTSGLQNQIATSNGTGNSGGNALAPQGGNVAGAGPINTVDTGNTAGAGFIPTSQQITQNAANNSSGTGINNGSASQFTPKNEQIEQSGTSAQQQVAASGNDVGTPPANTIYLALGSQRYVTLNGLEEPGNSSGQGNTFPQDCVVQADNKQVECQSDTGAAR